jgi:hypothetical protein
MLPTVIEDFEFSGVGASSFKIEPFIYELRSDEECKATETYSAQVV